LAFIPELILILGDIKFEAELWNHSQSVNFSIGCESFLVLTWSRMWNTVGKWSESRMSEIVQVGVWYSYGPQYPVHLHFPQGNNESDTVALWFWIH
jgi:hypothetical protein